MIYHNMAEIFTEINLARMRLTDGLPALHPQQATFKPLPDTWSVAQILEHLAKVDRALVTRIGKMLAELEEAEPQVKACASFVPFSMESIVEQANLLNRYCQLPASLSTNRWRNCKPAVLIC
jgi:uncharacterized damage-inducible protein DinB